MGADIAWLLPAAVICIVAGLVITRRAPRTDPTRAALIIWGGWLAVTAVVFSYMNGIVHPYYTVALAPAIAAGIGIGSTLLWQQRSDVRAATTLAGAILVTAVLAAVLLSRHGDWMPWLRAAVAFGGVGAAALILIAGRLGDVAARSSPVSPWSRASPRPPPTRIATAATPHSGAIPSVGPSHGRPAAASRRRAAEFTDAAPRPDRLLVAGR